MITSTSTASAPQAEREWTDFRSAIEVGDAVTLYHEGQPMAVTAIDGQTARVCWHDRDGKLQHGECPIGVLRHNVVLMRPRRSFEFDGPAPITSPESGGSLAWAAFLLGGIFLGYLLAVARGAA